MNTSSTKLAGLLKDAKYPLSAKYDPRWILEHSMGPNALVQIEMLTQRMRLKPGMRVLDMGCGKALTSIFLAKEFGVQVWANDLWISASDNWKRIREAGVENLVFPIHAEARELPYAEDFFDAILCADSYIYYGTDDLYLWQFVKFLKRGGQIGIVVPGLARAFRGTVPTHLRPFWGQDCFSWHTCSWWHALWKRTGLVEVETVDLVRGGWHLWSRWERAQLIYGKRKTSDKDLKVLRADKGRYMGFIRMIARRANADPKWT